MKQKVESYLKELFPIMLDLNIEEIQDFFKCTFHHYVSDSLGNPIKRTIDLKVKLIDGFFRIVD